MGADEAGEPLALRFALNPFDHADLLLAGVTDWSKTSDALIDGASVPGVLGLFLDGLRSGRLEMLLLCAGRVMATHALATEMKPVGGVATMGIAVDPEIGRADRNSPAAFGNPDAVAVTRPATAYDQVAMDDGHNPLLSPASLPQLLGFAIVSIQEGWLWLHLQYLLPANRGRGLSSRCVDKMVALAGAAGLQGLRLASTVAIWEKPEYSLTVKSRIRQEKGSDVTIYQRVV